MIKGKIIKKKNDYGREKDTNFEKNSMTQEKSIRN